MSQKGDSVEAFIEGYSRSRPLYERLVEEAKFVLRKKLDKDDVKIVSLLGRTKTADSLRNKVERKDYNKPWDEVTDLAGVRVVCGYEPDLALVGEAVRCSFCVHEHLDKTRDLGSDRMGYHGTHFVVSLGSKCSGPRYDDIRELKCEIQVRTVLQDAWAIISHHLVYKDEALIPTQMKRDLNNVGALLEVAQGVFDSARDKRTAYLDSDQA